MAEACGDLSDPRAACAEKLRLVADEGEATAVVINSAIKYGAFGHAA